MKNTFTLIGLLISTFAMSIMVTSCRKDLSIINEGKRQLFEATDVISIHEDGVVVYEFDKTKHQLAYTTDRKIYMVTNMEQTEYYALSTPSALALNSIIDVTKNTAGIPALGTATYRMRILKVEGSKYWLWDDDAVVGFFLDFQ